MLLKRAFDIAVSAAALLILSPLLAALAVAIVIDTGLPVFFTQERVGRAFHLFRLRKLRTMAAAAEGPLITAPGDIRVTRVGRFLRASKLDELPQLWNVICGEMSLVGPRPELSCFVELFRESYVPVLELRPGMTDVASLRYRREERALGGSTDPVDEYVQHILPEKIALAREYVRTRSFFGDLGILLRTFGAILAPRTPTKVR